MKINGVWAYNWERSEATDFPKRFVLVGLRQRPGAEHRGNRDRVTAQRVRHVLATERRRPVQRAGFRATRFRFGAVHTSAACPVQLQDRRKCLTSSN